MAELFVAKNLRIFENYGLSAWAMVMQGGVEAVQIFFGQEGEVNCLQFFTVIFYERSFMTSISALRSQRK